jgi:predicted nucleic acid-binding protein
MSAGKAFFDTNVLLYVYSTADPEKQARALALYREHAPEGRMLLSTQVVQEFIVAALRKLRLARDQVRDIAFTLFDLPLVVIGIPHIRAAMDNADRFNISFWDALIVAAAEAGGAEVLYTEDLNDGQQYGEVVARNPFRPTGRSDSPT